MILGEGTLMKIPCNLHPTSDSTLHALIALASVGYERIFFELERAERKNFRAEPSTSENYKINFRAEPSSSGKSFERLRARAKPSEHKSFFEHDFSFNFEQLRAKIKRKLSAYLLQICLTLYIFQKNFIMIIQTFF